MREHHSSERDECDYSSSLVCAWSRTPLAVRADSVLLDHGTGPEIQGRSAAVGISDPSADDPGIAGRGGESRDRRAGSGCAGSTCGWQKFIRRDVAYCVPTLSGLVISESGTITQLSHRIRDCYGV